VSMVPKVEWPAKKISAVESNVREQAATGLFSLWREVQKRLYYEYK
jgi:hypothetical protein